MSLNHRRIKGLDPKPGKPDSGSGKEERSEANSAEITSKKSNTYKNHNWWMKKKTSPELAQMAREIPVKSNLCLCTSVKRGKIPGVCH